jgi:alpha-tubulin suppressor-like RCC1 family protein
VTETLTRPPQATAFAWGYNNSGALGLGHAARAYHPVPAALSDGAADVQGGGEFTVVRTSSGELFACGGNTFGQLGDGTTKTRLAWGRVPLPTGTIVADVRAGTDHVLVRTERGEVYAWGRNHRSQVDSFLTGNQLTARRVIGSGATALGAGNAISAAITSAGRLVTWGRKAATLLPEGVKATAVDAGYQHIVVLTSSGDVFTFGVDPKGEPLPGKVMLRHSWGQVRAVRAGNSFTLALTSRGLLLAWGENSAGQLGVGDQEDRAQPVVVTFPADAGPVIDFWAGDHSAVALTTNHEVYTWGQTRWGQGGTGRTDRPQASPSRITALDGAHLTRVYGGANHVIVTA